MNKPSGKDWRPPVGTRVKLTNHQFFPNRRGTVIRHDEWFGQYAMAVELDSGETPGVISEEQYVVIGDWMSSRSDDG